jgi:hypothetical protein
MFEILIAIGLLSIVIMGVTSGFFQQQMATKTTGDRNTAITLAELTLEENMKLPGNQLTVGDVTDYVLVTDQGFGNALDTAPKTTHMRRIVSIGYDYTSGASSVATIRVQVWFGKKGKTYPFHVTLNTSRRMEV